ncbi:MAG: hypothetical protein IJS09_07890 [Treponema sp.]|nr:hypothetical protein [Treponema sp.]
MKRLIVVFCAVFATTLFFGCSNDDTDSSNAPEQKKSVAELIASAKAGDTVLLSSGILADSASLTVDKAIVLSGGNTSFDAKSATITVSAAGATVKNVKNIKELIVDEAVGTGDVTIDTCEIVTVTIKGGGENSVHFVNSIVAVMNTVKKNVRLVLEKVSRICSMSIKAACHIEALNVQSFVENVIVDKSVEEVKLSGKPTITSLVTNSDATATEQQKTKIVIASSDVEINKAANKAEDASGKVTVQEIVQETTSAEIAAVTYEPLTEKEVEQTEKVAEDVKSGKTSIEDIVKKPDVEIDNPGPLTLRTSSYGVQIKVAVPKKSTVVGFYRAEYDEAQYKADPKKLTWNHIGGYNTRSECAIPESTVSFTDYYVEPGKTYCYYTECKGGNAYNVLETSEIDTITATAGRGLLKLPNDITINIVKGSFEFSQTGYADVTNFHGDMAEATPDMGVYLRPASDTTAIVFLDSSKYCFISNITSKKSTIQFREGCVGVPLELVGAKVSYKVTKGDVKWAWDTLPAKAIGGTGFTDGKITFTQEELPIKVSDASTGISITADTSKIAQKGRLRFSVQKDYDKDWLYIRPASGNVLSDAVYTLTDSAVAANSLCKVCVEFQEYSETENSYSTAKQFNVVYTPKTGTGVPVWSKNLKATFDNYSQTAYITSDPSTWFESGFTLPESITLSVNGTGYSLKRTSASPAVKVKDVAYTFDNSMSFNSTTADGTTKYVGNAFFRLNSALDKKLYPYGNNSSFRYNDNTYRVDYYPSDDRYAPIAGLPESITPKDIYTGHFYTITQDSLGCTAENPASGKILFDTVAADKATVTIQGKLPATTIMQPFEPNKYLGYWDNDETMTVKTITESVTYRGYWDSDGYWHASDSDTYMRDFNTTATAKFNTNSISIPGIGTVYFAMPSATTIKLTK